MGRARIAIRFLLPYLLPVLVLGVICSGIGTLPTGSTHPLAYLSGGLVVVGLAFAFLGTRLRRGILSTVIRMSPVGVELRDDLGSHTRIRWVDVTGVGTTYTQTSDRRGVAVGGLNYSVKAHRDLGIVGWGERLLPKSAPKWMRQQQNAAPRHPRSGLSHVAIPLGAVDPTWLHGHLGAWVRQYRPDLLQQADPSPGQQNPSVR